MKTNLLAKIRVHFCHPDAPRHVARHNMRAWVRSVRHLGPKWILLKHNQEQRKEPLSC